MDTRELKRGLVSVIIPTYNSERQIEKTLRSVLAQDYECYEILVVDDCSLDRTRQIVEEWAEQDERIKLLALEKNGGAAVSRNFGLQEAQGQYVAFLDSDDAWLPGKLSKQLVFMKQYPTSGL